MTENPMKWIDLSSITKDELLHDRQECYNDLAALAVSVISGVKEYSGGTVDERIKRNLEMVEIIRKECQRRGFDPAKFQAE